MSLLPKEEKFYHMMEELAGFAYQSVEQLNRIVRDDDPMAIVQIGQSMSEIKAKAKRCYYNMTSEICRTFITPFDREDIQAFGHTLYKIPKIADKIQERMIVHRLQPFNGDFTSLVDIISQQNEALKAVIGILNNNRKLNEMNERVATLHELEDRGDHLLGRLIADLFWSISDTRELILRKDIYEMLEEVTDYYRDCANVALQIVLKHS
ncbi:MAG: DUF47 family protein [Vampirovibrionales bacterium]|nr:DUF47 family protein [Vampirovibrionales bacterium]